MFRQLQIETTTVCNGHCIFCPHDRYEAGEIGTMDEALFEKIIRDASHYPFRVVYPMLTGEPFCDPDIIERIKLIRSLMPNVVIKIFTNASLLTGAQIDELAGIGGVAVSVSLNGARAKTREILSWLEDFDPVVEKIGYLSRKGLLEATSTVWHPTVTVKEINEMVKFPKPDVFQFHNFAGEIYPYRNVGPTNCSRLNVLTVKWNGDTALCCFDYRGQVAFGNLREKTIMDIWDNPLYQLYRSTHERGEGHHMTLCKSCTQGGV